MSIKVKLKFIKPPGLFPLAYFPGMIGAFEPKQAAELIDAGICVPVEEKQSNTLPADMPGRKELYAAGFNSLEECIPVNDFTQIKGIGKPTADKIVKYLNK